ncbi:MAG TPA: DUF177 domain-containing protein [Candidatus Acidoferrales bacterium]|nr:DUF177 domain-containing protein [Candidatus Acidoferrales bacterium]
MFLDIHELALHRIPIRKSYSPGSLDFHTTEFKQVEALAVRATAELVDNQIHIFGTLHTRLELSCARCLDAVMEEVSRDFDLIYRPLSWVRGQEEMQLRLDDTEIAFFQGDGLFLADILAEQVNLAVPMKAICRSDCRGLCPHCGANLNYEQCGCEARAADPRLASLERFKLEWFKKH